MHNESLAIARNTLLRPAAISEQQLENILAKAMGTGIDMADIFLQYSHGESWALEDGIVKGSNFSINRGVGIRAISGEKTGFAYSNDIILSALEKAAKTARNIASSGAQKRVQVFKSIPGHQLYSAQDPLITLTEHDKVALLQRIDKYVREQDPRIKQVMVSLAGVYNVILVLSSDGNFNADVRPLVRLNVTVVAEEKGRYERATYSGGGRTDYGFFLQDETALNYANEAARIALLNLHAVSAPAGTMPVVLGPGWPGVLLHEAVGHGLEGDFNRKGSSAFSGRIGQQVASSVCTVVDNGKLSGQRRGSLNIDDEGTPTEETVLIENGILKGYMQDKLNARLMGKKHKVTGNGRRESYASIPLPRMTNTYLLPGKYTPTEIINSVTKGIYAVNFSGGQVDITSGKFVFSTSEAYLIENGKITQPLKNATLIGDGPTVLTKVSMLGNDLQLDPGVGTCGKEGQSVPVGVGQPTLKIDEITVGGAN